MEEQTLTDPEVTGAGSSPAETTTPETPASGSEPVKSVTEEGQEDGGKQEQSKAVPYEVFAEANKKAKMAEIYEEILIDHFDKLVKDPKTGKYRLDFSKVTPKKEEPEMVEDLTDEEKAVFSELHENLYPTLDKKFSMFGNNLKNEILGILKENERGIVEYRTQSNLFFEKAKEQFGEDVNNPKSALYQRAHKILIEELAETDKEGNTRIPPRAQFDAFEKAAFRLQREAQGKFKSEKEKEPIKKQGSFVSSGGKGTGPVKMTVEEFGKLSDEEQRELMRQEISKKTA